MENKTKIEIEKVQIPDLKNEAGKELSESEQDTIAAGGEGYGYDPGNGS